MKKKHHPLISKILCGTYIAISLFVYVCPLIMGVHAQDVKTFKSVICNNSSVSTIFGNVNGMDMAGDCYRAHTTLASYLMGVLQETNSPTLIVLSLIIFTFIFALPSIGQRERDTSLRDPVLRYWHKYRVRIRILFQKKIRAWFVLIQTVSVASIA